MDYKIFKMNWMCHKFVISTSVIFLFLYEFSEELSGDSQKEFNQRFPGENSGVHDILLRIIIM